MQCSHGHELAVRVQYTYSTTVMAVVWAGCGAGLAAVWRELKMGSDCFLFVFESFVFQTKTKQHASDPLRSPGNLRPH